ncbi:CBN-MLT-10 protein, partial [Aphelenchoides avenae]
LDDVIRSPKKLKKFITGRKSRPSKDPVEKVMSLVHEGVKIGYSLAGQNVSDFDQKSLKVVSPRMFSVVAEESDDKTVDLLSPSLFSLHNEGKGIENLTSIPNLVRAFGDKDRQQWMDLILEAAGVNDNAEMLERDLEEDAKASHNHIERYKREFRAPNGTPLYLTKENVTERFGEFERRKIETFEKLEATYTKEQMKEMNQTGFAILTPAQLYMLYGPQSPYNSSSTLSRLLPLNRSSVHEGIEADVHRISAAEKVHVRHKRAIVNFPIVLTPIVLNLPASASQPIVLSPVVLSPVFTPFILSPIALSPLILNPMVGSPLVLSPFVLSPIIVSPMALSALVLSPYALSPIILSPLISFHVILSPSWLS